MFTVCIHHIEIAIEQFIDEHEEAPDLVSLAETSTTALNETTPTSQCYRCELPGSYVVMHRVQE